MWAWTGFTLFSMRWDDLGVKGASQCHYMSFFFVKMGHIGHINPAHFPPNIFIFEIWCWFTFCPYSRNITESSWKCVTALVKKNICVKILPHANIPARKAALVRNYSLIHSVIFDQINADVLFRRVNYLWLATFTCPIVFLYPVSTWMAVNGL